MGLWFSECQPNRTSALAIMEKSKNGHHFVNIDCTENFEITKPPKVWVSSYASVDGDGILVLAIMEKSKKWPPFR